MPIASPTRASPKQTPSISKRPNSARVGLDDFLDKSRVLKVISSNVKNASYDEEEEILYVTYKNGGAYAYLRISELEARGFYFASFSSPGKWIWSNLRVRGSKTAHQKPYYRMD